jgi:hypothetical protein
VPEDKKRREASRDMQALALDGLEAYGIPSFTRTVGWRLAETQILLMSARKNFREILSDGTFSVNVLN